MIISTIELQISDVPNLPAEEILHQDQRLLELLHHHHQVKLLVQLLDLSVNFLFIVHVIEVEIPEQIISCNPRILTTLGSLSLQTLWCSCKLI